MKKNIFLGLSMFCCFVACDPASYVANQEGILEKGPKTRSNTHSSGSESASLEGYLEAGDSKVDSAKDPTKWTKVKATVYYIPNERHHSSGRYVNVKVRNSNGTFENVKMRSSFFQELKLQGSGILADGRTVNVYGKNSWQFTSAKYGLGTAQEPLIPFKSIAVDRAHFPHLKNGAKVFIPSTKGLIIPGTDIVHDGYWIVTDVGSAIKGKRIDMFAGDMHWREFQRYLSDPRNFSSAHTAQKDEVRHIGSPSKYISMMI